MRLLKTKKKTQNCKELKKYARDLNGGGGIFIDRQESTAPFLVRKEKLLFTSFSVLEYYLDLYLYFLFLLFHNELCYW